MAGLEFGVLTKLAGIALAAGGIVSGGLGNAGFKDVADLGGKIAEAFGGPSAAGPFSAFARRIAQQVEQAIDERARSPRNRDPAIVQQNLDHALQRFAAGLDRMLVSPGDFARGDLAADKIADNLVASIARFESCFREGGENREARPLAREIFFRAVETALSDKAFWASLGGAVDRELLTRTTGLSVAIAVLGDKIDRAADESRAAHGVSQAMLAEVLARLPDPSAIKAEALRSIVEALQIAHVPQAEWPAKALEAIEGLLAKQHEPVVPTNQGADVDATIRQARDVAPDVQRAVGILREGRAHLREERLARQRAEAALLKEEAEFLSLTYRHSEAIEVLEEAIGLDPDDPWLYFKCGDLHQLIGTTEVAFARYREGGEAAARNGRERELSVSYDRIGDIQVAQGDLVGAFESVRNGLEIRDRRASSDAGHAGWQHDLMLSHSKIGDIQVAQGNLAGALTSFRKSLEITERLVSSDAEHTSLQRDLSVSLSKIGDVQLAQGDLDGALTSFRNGLEIAKRIASSDRDNAGLQRDLANTLDRVGHVLMAQGDLIGALTSFRKGLAIREPLAMLDPANTRRQHDVSISYESIGNVHLAQRDFAGALIMFRKGLQLRERLAASDPGHAGWQRDLSVAVSRIGEVQLMLQDLAGALTSFQRDLQISEELALSDPSNAGWQRDLTVSLRKIGTIHAAQGDLAGGLVILRKALDIAERLAVSDPRNAGWQRDLSISCEKIGDVQLAQGDLSGALTSARRAMRIRKQLASSDLGNVGWQRDLSIAYEKIGNVRQAQGDLAGALTGFRKGLEIAERLALSDPRNAGWQHDLIDLYSKLARIGNNPCRNWTAAHAIAQRLANEGRLAPHELYIVESTRQHRDRACG